MVARKENRVCTCSGLARERDCGAGKRRTARVWLRVTAGTVDSASASVLTAAAAASGLLCLGLGWGVLRSLSYHIICVMCYTNKI